MKSLLSPLRILAFSTLLPVAAMADEPPCSLVSSVLITQDQGSVTIGCAGITEAYGNQLAALLNQILQNRLDPQSVMEKLQEVESLPEEGVARALDDMQRQAIISALHGKSSETVAIIAHPNVEDSADYARSLATPLIMIGWQIEGHQVRRAAPKPLDPVTGVALVVRNKDTPPEKAVQLKRALAAAHIQASLLSDPSMAADGTILWIGRRLTLQAAEQKP
jgi:hypothetical protein